MSTHGVRSHSKPLTDERPGADDGTSPIELKTSGLGGDVLHIEEAMIERLSAQADGAMTCLLFHPGTVPQQVVLADLPKLLSVDDNFVWVDITRADVQTVKQVAQMLELHEHAVERTIAAWQPPRLDLFGNHFLVTTTLRQLDAVGLRIEAQKVAFVVGRNFLVSIHQQPLPFISRVLQRATQNAHLIEYDAMLMLFILLDELLEYYELLKEQVQGQIELMEERALTETSTVFLRDVLHFKRYTFALSQLASQHRPIFTAFLRPDFTHIAGRRVASHFRDLDARHMRLEDAFLAAKDTINTIFSIYVSHVSHFTNQVMKTLTIVSTMLLPASLIIALFSASHSQSIGSFVLMLASIALCSALVLWIFHYKGWLWQ